MEQKLGFVALKVGLLVTCIWSVDYLVGLCVAKMVEYLSGTLAASKIKRTQIAVTLDISILTAVVSITVFGMKIMGVSLVVMTIIVLNPLPAPLPAPAQLFHPTRSARMEVDCLVELNVAKMVERLYQILAATKTDRTQIAVTLDISPLPAVVPVVEMGAFGMKIMGVGLVLMTIIVRID